MSQRARVWFPALLSAMWLTMGGAAARAQAPTAGQQPEQKANPLDLIEWQIGPTVAEIGDMAEIKLPAGYRFSGKAGTRKFLELTENPSSGNELGVLIPEPEQATDFWFVIFEFSDIGYVKDDEKDKLDADAILKSIQEGTEASNKVRRQRGWDLFHVVGWHKAPFYDPKTNNLTWAIRGRAESASGPGGESVNYSVRILGRRGTMNVDLVLGPESVAAVVPGFEDLLGGFNYLEGHTYAEFRSGDKLAAYGLTGLVAGGAAAAALKSGLLQKFWKLIVAGVVALAAAAKKFWSSIRRKQEPQESSVA